MRMRAKKKETKNRWKIVRCLWFSELVQQLISHYGNHNSLLFNNNTNKKMHAQQTIQRHCATELFENVQHLMYTFAYSVITNLCAYYSHWNDRRNGKSKARMKQIFLYISTQTKTENCEEKHCSIFFIASSEMLWICFIGFLSLLFIVFLLLLWNCFSRTKQSTAHLIAALKVYTFTQFLNKKKEIFSIYFYLHI